MENNKNKLDDRQIKRDEINNKIFNYLIVLLFFIIIFGVSSTFYLDNYKTFKLEQYRASDSSFFNGS